MNWKNNKWDIFSLEKKLLKTEVSLKKSIDQLEKQVLELQVNLISFILSPKNQDTRINFDYFFTRLIWMRKTPK